MPKQATRILALLVLLPILPSAALAQFENKPMAIGSLNNIYSETGGQQEYWNNDVNGLRWPAIRRAGVLRADALWIAAQNLQDADGTTYPVRIVHVGPRSNGAGEFFPISFNTVSKFEPPQVTVDGLDSYEFFPDNDAVDPDLPADRMIVSKVNTLLGISLTKRVYAYSQPFNDNYHIQEYVLTNTGNADADEEQELDQTLEGVYLHFQKRYTISDRIESPGGGWGANVMNDIVGDGMEDYDVDFRAQYTWLGNFQNGTSFDEAGTPLWTDAHDWVQQGDSTGRLTSTQFVGIVTLHADTSPDDPADDPGQPSTTGHIDADDPLTSNNDAFNVSQMEREYDMLSRGHMYPHHADLVDLDDNFLTPDGDPMIGKAGGWTSMFSYGPYTLEPGDSVRIVLAEAIDGLDLTEATIIGRDFKRLANSNKDQATTALATTPNITYRGVTLGKNQWWWSGRDSLFQTFDDAIDAYEQSGGLASYAVPEPPRPPASFAVESGVDQISLSWTTYDNQNPPGGFELYRTQNYIEGQYTDNFEYECVAGCDGTPPLGPEARSYQDTDVFRGINYFYYLLTVGDVNSDPTAGTPTGVPLKSNRYWTQTYDPASLKRPPGETTASFKIVPNPLNLASDETVRWPGARDERLAFLDIPGQCTIRIYSERGDHVRTIEHTDGSGDEFWDLTTESQQVVVSGLYIAVIDNHETSEREVKKFVVIR